MNPKLLIWFLKKLLKEKERTRQEIEYIENELSSIHAGAHCELSHTSTITDWDLPSDGQFVISVYDRILSTKYQVLNSINIALNKIKCNSPSFGFCEICQNPIALRRLKFIPYARLCIKCQNHKDKYQTSADSVAKRPYNYGTLFYLCKKC